jgi:acyl-homoserine lactone acylase PvdQ
MLHRDEALQSRLTGSNGFAVAPSKTLSGNAILYINPHVTFYFRPEVHMVSDEGLNAYGAVTWGQFFVYQGFNEHCGWMHTSSDADVADLYEETIVQKDNNFFYRYDNNLRPVVRKQVFLTYDHKGKTERLPLTTYYTHHGPVMGSRDGKWLSLKENNRSLNALMQSWLRLKAKGFDDFEKTMQLRSNNSNNTVFADDKGHIAYWHGNFMPARDAKSDWQLPVDGSTSKTEWKGIHPLNEIVHVYNPATGWIQNCNSTPYSVSGSSSPKKIDYPEYMAPDAENFRAMNAVKLLGNENKFTIDKMIAVGYDHYLSAFEVMLPPLISAFDSLPAADALKSSLQEPVELLRSWDKRSSTSSVATTLAIEWGYKMLAKSHASRNVADMSEMTKIIAAKDLLMLLAEVVSELKDNFGTWKVTWGEVNRFQRRTGDINEAYKDDEPSIPSGLASSTWGSLPAFEGRRFAGSKKRYGTGGNSFVAAIEFGKTVKAKSILAGGENSDPSSKHFFDQALPYVEGRFKDVLFYKDDVMKHVERKYHPGE